MAVSGGVTYQGKPVEDGMIQFIPSAETQGPTAGAEIKGGKFSIPAQNGPVPGTYRVEVSSYQDVKKATQKDMAGATFGRPLEQFQAGDQTQMIRRNVIPPKYNAASELKASIPKQSSFEANFDLK